MHFEQRVRKGENASEQQDMKTTVRTSLDCKDPYFKLSDFILTSCL